MATDRYPTARNWFVLVAGWPGSGKSTLAAGLATELGLPLLSKDEIKEALMDGLGRPETVAESRQLGRAAVLAMLRVAAHCPAHNRAEDTGAVAHRTKMAGRTVDRRHRNARNPQSHPRRLDEQVGLILVAIAYGGDARQDARA